MKAAAELAAIDVESLVAEVADRFTDEVKQGRAPSVEEYAERHPEIAHIIRQVFPTLAMLDTFPATGLPDARDDEHVAGVLGDYRVFRELGRGGMGVVYEAEQISLGRRVALKVLPFAAMLDRQQLARFKNEARAAATLDHPNIVAIYSVGVERGVHYYAMHLVEGQSLAQVVEQLRRDQPQGASPRLSWNQADVVSKKPEEESKKQVGSRPRDGGRLVDGPVCPPPPCGEGLGEGILGTDNQPTISHPTSSIQKPASSIRHPASDIATAPVAALSTLHAPSTSLPAFSSGEYFRTIAQLGIQAAEALDHAHQNGILHRDIKPANLLLDDTGKLRITDFGLARIEQDAGMTMTGDLLGTLRYMSPEQALAKRVVIDHRSDIYSLGVTLYELLTLQPAYAADDRQELLRQIAFDEPRKLRQVNPRIPQDLETIVLKAIEKNPADRYATSLELAADLRRFANDLPIKARRQSVIAHVRKWSRRNRPVVWATVAALLVSVLVLAASIGWVARDRAARQVVAEGIARIALGEARQLTRDEKWTAALAAAKRASAALAGTASQGKLSAEALELQKDIEMALQLDDIRLQKEIARNGTVDFFDTDTDRKYSQAFRDYGINIESSPPSEIAKDIKSRSIQLELAAALDSWADFRLQRIPGDQSWKRLVEVARAADPDPWRNRLRDEFGKQHKERVNSLKELTATANQQDLPLRTVLLLADQLRDAAPQQAVDLLKRARSKHPDDFQINWRIGTYCEFWMNPPALEEATRYYMAATASRPNSATAFLNLGVALAREGKLDESISATKNAIRLQPNFADAHSNLGVALFNKRLLDDSIASSKEAIRLKPDFYHGRYALGLALEKKGLLDEAIASYREAIRLKPDHVDSLHNLGNALIDKGLYDDAIDSYRAALRFTPNDASPLNGIAIALEKKGLVDDAIATWKEAIQLDPNCAPAHYNLGGELYGKDLSDEAITHLKEAIRINPDFWEAHGFLGLVLFQKTGKVDDAILSFKEAIRINPDDDVSYLNLGTAFRQKGELDAAIAAYENLVRLKPDWGGGQYHIGDILLQKGLVDEAVSSLRESIRVAPQHGDSRAALGRALLRKGEIDEAVDSFKDSIRVEPEYAAKNGVNELVEDALRRKTEADDARPFAGESQSTKTPTSDRPLAPVN